jgi:hypothetical protein
MIDSLSDKEFTCMYPVPGICPVCGDELAVTRLHCGRCATTLEGLFTLGRFHYLTREQQQFIGIFIKCRGKIKDVEQALDISYPTVVKLLDEVVTALEADTVEIPELPAPAPEPAISPERRRVILDDLSNGRISSAEALRLLQGGEEAPPAPAADVAAPQVAASPVAVAAGADDDESLASAQ